MAEYNKEESEKFEREDFSEETEDNGAGRIGYHIFKNSRDRDSQDPRDATSDRHYWR